MGVSRSRVGALRRGVLIRGWMRISQDILHIWRSIVGFPAFEMA
jgi:hypothetical protein